MEENKDLKQYGTATIKYIQEDGSKDMELIIPYNQEIVIDNGKYILRDKKPQYPKTYGECCDVLGVDDRLYLTHRWNINYDEILVDDYSDKVCDLLNGLRSLLICRDAYWKIAGEQMGLDKPWKPEFKFGKKKYCIMTKDNRVITATVEETNRILNFPTEEMRDTFYENFKELIDECKELL